MESKTGLNHHKSLTMLTITVMISCFFIVQAINQNTSAITYRQNIQVEHIEYDPNNGQVPETLLLTKVQAAEYLGITQYAFERLLKSDCEEREGVSVHDPYRFIPYLEYEGVIYFTKSELIKWAEYRMHHN